MPLSIVFILLLAAALHATWNILLKQQEDKVIALNTQLLAATAISMAGALYFGIPEKAVWVYILPSVCVHLLYHILLLWAYQTTDINVAYPILRGVAPLLAAVFAFIVLDERPSTLMAIGVITITGGILLLAIGVSWRSVYISLLTAAVIAVYNVIDAQGVRVGGASSLQYVCWLLMLDSLLFLPFALRQRPWPTLLRLPVKMYALGALGGFASVAAYALVLYAYTRAPIGAVAALRETSIIMISLVGYYVLKERGAMRLPGACVVLLGVILLIADKG